MKLSELLGQAMDDVAEGDERFAAFLKKHSDEFKDLLQEEETMSNSIEKEEPKQGVGSEEK